MVTHTVKRMQLLDFRTLLSAVPVGYGDVHTCLQRATVHTSHGDTSRVGRVIQRRDKHLRRTLQLLRCGYHLHYLVQQILYIIRRRLIILCHPALLCRAIHYREVQLILRSVQGKHQVKHHLIYFLRATVRLIHLVDNHNGLQSYLQRFLQHEACLRHGAFKGIYEQYAAVGHIQHTLHLTAEVTMPRSVDDVYLRTLPVDGHILRQDGDTSFPLQVVGIQHLT